MNQREMILRHFKQKGSLTQSAAMKHYGIGRLAARIHELINQGHNISKTMIDGKNRFGDKTTFASYRLVK